MRMASSDNLWGRNLGSLGVDGSKDLRDFNRSLVELVVDEKRLEGKIAGRTDKSS